MHNEHASTKQIVLTLVGWGVGLLAVLAIIVAASTAIAPKIPPDTAPVPEATATTASVPVAPPIVAPPPVVSPIPTATPVPAPVPSPPPTRSVVPAGPLSGKVVVIDAGHQARGDSSLEPIGPGASTKKAKVAGGTSGVKTHNPESLINLQVALRLREELVRLGANVVMVRTQQNVNVSNSKRAAIANNVNADLFIRLHCDGSTNRAMVGLTTIAPQSNKWTAPIVGESRKAADYVHTSVVAQTEANDRGVVTRGDLSGFNWAKVPTVLVEMGFLSNAGEDVKLGTTAYQQDLAAGLAAGIEEYLAQR